jgi:hypothetical protein
MATNGSKWQLFGNILAADWHRTGSYWLPKWPQMAADWQLNGNKWQQGRGAALGRHWKARAARASSKHIIPEKLQNAKTGGGDIQPGPLGPGFASRPGMTRYDYS